MTPDTITFSGVVLDDIAFCLAHPVDWSWPDELPDRAQSFAHGPCDVTDSGMAWPDAMGELLCEADALDHVVIVAVWPNTLQAFRNAAAQANCTGMDCLKAVARAAGLETG